MDLVEAASGALQVVVVEDDESLLRLYEIKFGSATFPILLSAFKNARDAINHLTDNDADMVIVDMQLPDMNGEELIDNLFNLFPMFGTKVIIISGRDEEDIRAHHNLPDDVSVFPKPVPFNYLLEKLQLMHDFRQGLSPGGLGI
jgi:DNA-binding NtrC family response regulator